MALAYPMPAIGGQSCQWQIWFAYCERQATVIRLLSALTNSPRFEDAKCTTESNLDFFFPESLVEWEERLPRLKQLCGSCIHQVPCLAYAIENEIKDGFWGNTTPEQRQLHFKNKENPYTKRIREITTLLSQGFTKEQVAMRLEIQVESLERTLDRAKRKGLLL
jgi:DNA-binding NarL/FixJ family response regulator